MRFQSRFGRIFNIDDQQTQLPVGQISIIPAFEHLAGKSRGGVAPYFFRKPGRRDIEDQQPSRPIGQVSQRTFDLQLQRLVSGFVLGQFYQIGRIGSVVNNQAALFGRHIEQVVFEQNAPYPVIRDFQGEGTHIIQIGNIHHAEAFAAHCHVHEGIIDVHPVGVSRCFYPGNLYRPAGIGDVEDNDAFSFIGSKKLVILQRHMVYHILGAQHAQSFRSFNIAHVKYLDAGPEVDCE